MQRLARLARVGDAVDIANIHVEVEAMHGARVTSVLVSLIGVGRSP
jgi:CBS domain containing-hemolysin-like protein